MRAFTAATRSGPVPVVFDQAVKERLVAVLDGPKLAQRIQRLRGKQPDRIMDGIEKQEAVLLEIETDYANGNIKRDVYRRLTDQATAKLEALQANVKPVFTPDYDGLLAEAWEKLELGRKRAIVDAFIERVTTLPFSALPGDRKGSGPRFVSRRVELTWKS